MRLVFGLLNLQFDFIQRIIWQTFLLKAADNWNAVPLLLCCNTRLAELRWLRLQFQSVLATLRAFDAEKCSVSCANIFFFSVSYSLTSELRSSGPAEAAHPCRRWGPFYTLAVLTWRGESWNYFFDLNTGGGAVHDRKTKMAPHSLQKDRNENQNQWWGVRFLDNIRRSAFFFFRFFYLVLVPPPSVGYYRKWEWSWGVLFRFYVDPVSAIYYIYIQKCTTILP